MTAQFQKPLTMKRWILFTTYGWFIGILLVVGLAMLSEVIFKMTEDSGGQAAVGIGMGTGVGLMQWLAVRKYLISAQRLFWSSLVGFSLAFIARDIIAAIVDVPLTVEVTIPFAALFGAFISGWLQYRFVFKKIMDKAINWITYSMAGWLSATLITMGTSLLNLKMGEQFPKVVIAIIALLFLSIGGPVLGFISGWFVIPKFNTLNAETNK